MDDSACVCTVDIGTTPWARQILGLQYRWKVCWRSDICSPRCSILLLHRRQTKGLVDAEDALTTGTCFSGTKSAIANKYGLVDAALTSDKQGGVT